MSLKDQAKTTKLRTVINPNSSTILGNFSALKPLPEDPEEDPKGTDTGFLGSTFRTELHAFEDVKRFANLAVENQGAKFVGNQTLLAFAKNAQSLNAVADNLLNGKSIKSALGGIFKKVGSNTGVAALTVARTLAQIPLTGEGIHLDWTVKDGKYIKEDTNVQESIHESSYDNTIDRETQNTDKPSRSIISSPGDVDSDLDIFRYREQKVEDPFYNPDKTKPEIGYDGDPEKGLDSVIFNKVIGYGDVGIVTDGVPLDAQKSKRQPKEKSFYSTTNEYASQTASSGSYFEKRISNRIKVPTVGGDYKLEEVKQNLPEGLKPFTDTIYTLKKAASTGNPDLLKYSLGKEDPLTMLIPYHGRTLLSNGAVPEKAKELGLNGNMDYVPLAFETIDPGGGSTKIHFRAYLESLSDKYTGDVQGTRYVGRAEEFYTYQGFKRNIDFSFKVAALTRDELHPIYMKLNRLIGTTAPSYGSGNSFMRGTVTRIHLGDYLSLVAGYVTSVSLDWDKDTPWEINMDYAGKAHTTNPMKILPHILTATISFTAIHDYNVKNSSQFLINPDVTTKVHIRTPDEYLHGK